jgi:dTDP-4-amino-4,6-dideoxygalactose transaminase
MNAPIASRPASPNPRIYLSPPQVSPRERELLLAAFDSGWIAPLGPHVDAFEQEFAARLGVPSAVALCSGTAALHLALRVLGVGPGDRVATSTLTFVASANAIKYVGAEPQFIDSERASWNLDPVWLAEALEADARRGRHIKAVLAVDLLGQCADYQAIQRLCRFYEVPLIEDAAEALGASHRGEPAGTLGDIGCFSFNGNKIITTSSGGMLVTRYAGWAERARYLATQARDPAPHYEHSELGYNYRLSNLLAAIGRGQLADLERRVARRRAVFEFYRLALSDLPGIRFMPEASYGKCTRWLTCLTVDPRESGVSREELRVALEAQNIESRPLWKPMHMQPLYGACRTWGGAVAEQLFEQGLCLPSGSSLAETELTRIVETIRAASGRPSRAARRSNVLPA